MPTKPPYEAATREQILRYRTLTSILSWTGKQRNKAFGQAKGSISSCCFRYIQFNYVADLADILVRDDEVVAVTSNVDATKLRVVKLNDKMQSETAAFTVEAKSLKSEMY